MRYKKSSINCIIIGRTLLACFIFSRGFVTTDHPSCFSKAKILRWKCRPNQRFPSILCGLFILIATDSLAAALESSLKGFLQDYYVGFLLVCHTFLKWWPTFWLVIYLISDWFCANLIITNLAAYLHEQLVLIASIEVKEVWRACDRQINQEYDHQIIATTSSGAQYVGSRS